MNNETYRRLYAELEEIEHSGISISLENHPASPMQIVNTLMIREETNYMRDYVWDEKGQIQSLSFHNIKEH